MATPIIMPKQGQSVESCIITKWHKQVGDTVNEGDVLFSYETDKAAFEELSKVSGTMLAIFYEPDDDVECLLNVCVIGEAGEDFSAFSPKSAEQSQPSPSPAKPTQPQTKQPITPIETTKSDDEERIKISPRAKGLAKSSGADLRFATASGPEGRIIERDVQEVINNGKLVAASVRDLYTQSGVTNGTGIGGRIISADLATPVCDVKEEFETVPLSNIRKVIAKAMHTSLSQSAQLTLNSSFDAGNILAFRKNLKEKAELLNLPNITINDIIIYAVSRALINHKEMNAHFEGDTMRLYNTANIGVACDTPRGLMVPTLFGAQCLTLSEISKASLSLTTACKQGTITPDLLTGGTFTITNLGTLGVEHFTPVLNPPQTGILGVCSITERSKNGVFYPSMGLSLTFDHRAVDGAPAARFLQEIVTSLENFNLILAV